MPLFKKHHDAPVDTTGQNYPAGGMNDSAYNDPSTGSYPPQQGAYDGQPQSATNTIHPSGVGAPLSESSYGTQNTTHPSGVGAPVDNVSYGNQNTTHHGHPGAATAGGAATGAAAGHALGGHSGAGATVGGMAGNRASHEHNQPTAGYNDNYNGTNGAGGYNATHGTSGTDSYSGNGGYGGNTYNDGRLGQPGATTTQTMGSTIDPKEAKSMEMKGKAQQLAGMVLSSQSMKAKGAAKEQEAAAIRQQAENLEQTERHEAAARQARERAVAHGAHPDHGELGGARNTY